MTGIIKYFGLLLTTIVLVFFTAGCVSKKDDRGRVKAQPRGGEQITIQKLTDDFAKYNVYYSGIKPALAVGILFDPKDGDKTLNPDRWWTPLEDQESLSSTVRWMRAHADRHIPTVQLIMGPNSQLFGYIYTWNINTKFKVVSDKEILVYAPVP